MLDPERGRGWGRIRRTQVEESPQVASGFGLHPFIVEFHSRPGRGEEQRFPCICGEGLGLADKGGRDQAACTDKE
jgi:hypothetical protein